MSLLEGESLAVLGDRKLAFMNLRELVLGANWQFGFVLVHANK